MITTKKALVLTATLAGILGINPAHAHRTYNVTGFGTGDGLAFSTNGSDGLWNASAQNTLATPQYIVAPTYAGGGGPSCGNATTGACPPTAAGGSYDPGALPVSWMSALHATANTPGEVFNLSTADALTAGAPGNFQLAVSGNSTGTGMDFGYIRVDNAQNAPGYGIQVTVSADVGSSLVPYAALFGGWDDSWTGSDGTSSSLGFAGGSSTPFSDRGNSFSYVDGAGLNSSLKAIGLESANIALAQSVSFFFQSPASGHYTLAIGGVNGTSGNYTYSITTVPVPAAVWMFGAGLMGWLGIQKRKMAA